jgi:molybdenum cofactor cytidylyltransferase
VADGRIAGVLLAAGEGSRFEGDAHKLLSDFRGRPLVAWAAEAVVAAGLGGCCIVTGAVDLAAVVRPLGLEVVENRRWREGQASSLQTALAWCRAGGFEVAVVGLGDQPLVPAGAWRTVAEADVAPIVTATYGGKRRPPVRLDGSVWGLLPAEGDEGARLLMQRRPDLVGEVACEGDPADVDTMADIRRHAG